jgi:hypothetical protein
MAGFTTATAILIVILQSKHLRLPLASGAGCGANIDLINVVPKCALRSLVYRFDDFDTGRSFFLWSSRRLGRCPHGFAIALAYGGCQWKLCKVVLHLGSPSLWLYLCWGSHVILLVYANSPPISLAQS